jgi:hypothetical protein
LHALISVINITLKVMVESTVPYIRLNGLLTLPYIDPDLKASKGIENASEVCDSFVMVE